jgi:pilus assembly protein CpaB
VALASSVGTLSLLLRKAGELADSATRRVTLTDLSTGGAPAEQARFVTVGVTRAMKREDYSVPVEGSARSAALLGH